MFASTVFYWNTNTIIKVKYKTITVHTECRSLCFLCLGKKSSFIPHNRLLQLIFVVTAPSSNSTHASKWCDKEGYKVCDQNLGKVKPC